MGIKNTKMEGVMVFAGSLVEGDHVSNFNLLTYEIFIYYQIKEINISKVNFSIM